jgi:antirestriction protein ArdC
MSRKKSRGLPTEAERAERREAERRLMADAVDRLRTSEGWRRWLAVRSHFHDYTLRNQILIALQCPKATRVAGFKRWLALGYAVRKGERSIRIWAPCPPTRRAMDKWRREGAVPEEMPRTYFRMVGVFDRSQVEPLPDFPGGVLDLDPPIVAVDGDGLASLYEPLVSLASEIGVTVVIGGVPSYAGGVFRPAESEIGLQPVSSEVSPNHQLKTLLHEVGHALVHLERTDEDPTLTYGEEEVVVECVAFTVCAAVGLDTSGFSVPYIATWSKGDELERLAGLVDRHARRLEDVVSDGRTGRAEKEPEAQTA